MLRDLSLTNSDGSGILGIPFVGVLASELPTGFPAPGLLANDVDAADPVDMRYRVEITSWPSAGTLTVDEYGAFSFTGAPDGTYTGTEKVYKNNAPLDATYSFTIGAAVQNPAPTATVTGVTVTPGSVTMAPGVPLQFSASVQGTNSPAQTVTWATTAGTISSSGLFTAPASTGSPQTVTITATSTFDTGKSGTASVTVTFIGVPTVTLVTVTPPAAVLAGSSTQQFTAVVTGTNSPSQAVNWSTTAGVISADGVLTTPPATLAVQTITVTATSAADASKSGTAVVTIAALAILAAQKVSGAQPVDASQAINRLPLGSAGKRALASVIEGLIDDMEKLRAANAALAAKLDADAGVTDSDYLTTIAIAPKSMNVIK